MAVVILTSKNFQTEVFDSEKPVLIDFWASWCMPCKMLAPIIEEVAKEVEDVKVCKLNIDDEEELANKFNIMSIPTLVFIKNGEIVEQISGVRPKSTILDIIKK